MVEGAIVTGNVLTDGTDDVFGADGAATTVPAGGVIGVAAGSDTSSPVSAGVGTPITGSFGTLTLNADGSYSYDGNPNVVPPAGATDVFVYTIKDGDGDTSTTTLTIKLTDSGRGAEDDVTVNEAALDMTRCQTGPTSRWHGDGLAAGIAAETDAANQLDASGGGALTYALVAAATRRRRAPWHHPDQCGRQLQSTR